MRALGLHVEGLHRSLHLLRRHVGRGLDALDLELELVGVAGATQGLVVGDQLLLESWKIDWSKVCIPYWETPAAIASWMSFVFSLLITQSRMNGVVIITSTAGTRPWPSARGMRRMEMTALRTPESCRRICFCWWGGETEMVRLMGSVASSVCRVESTRWPVSAAVIAVSIVS